MDLTLLSLATLPPIILLYFVYSKDLYEKEPRHLIIKSFAFGVLGFIPIYIIEVSTSSIFESLFWFMLIGVAFVEEGVKFLILRYYMYNKSDFNEPYDGIVYAVAISLGFAFIENIGYVYNYAPGSEYSVAIARMFTAIPMHAACGVIMGYYVGLAKFSSDKGSSYIVYALFFATLLHGLYNYFMLLGFTEIIAIIILIVGISYARKAINMHQQNSPFKK